MQSALGDAGTLSESWVFAEAARRLGASEEWQAMITTSKSGDVKAPDVICSVAPSGLDVECFNIHEHMKSIAPEQGRLHTASGNSSTDSAQIQKGRHSVLGSWWCLAWELAKKELRLTYPGEIRLRDPNIPTAMFSDAKETPGIYNMLFPDADDVKEHAKGEKKTQ